MDEAEQARLRALDAAGMWETPSEPRFGDTARARQRGAKVETGAPVEASLPRVLVVDDDARKRRRLELLLAPVGYEIVHAASGEDALACIARDPGVALVLLELAMPGLDGIETCRQVRTELGLVDVPIVFVIAPGDRSERMRARTPAPTTSCSSPSTRSSCSPG